MKKLNVKFGDKGAYNNATNLRCEVVWVGSDSFVTKAAGMSPTVHWRDGLALHYSGAFDFIPDPQTRIATVAVWWHAEDKRFCCCERDPSVAYGANIYPEQRITMEIPLS